MLPGNELSVLTYFMSANGNKPYRELIEKEIRRIPAEQLSATCRAWVHSFPPNVASEAKEFIRGINSLVAIEEFWKFATCQSAFTSIIEIAIQELPIDDGRRP